MQTDLANMWRGRRAAHPQAITAPCAESARAAADLAVWVSWEGDATELNRLMKPIGVLEQHTLTSLQLVNAESGLWRCGFAFVGRGPDQNGHVLSLLRRIAARAPWLRVDRMGAA